MKQDHDPYWMKLAVTLANEGEGLTRPNPPVGAVVVKNGRLIGEGFHPKAGQPHAEIIALQAAGPQSKNATLYITLEPCCTQGRTPPCTEAIIRAGVKQVVYGCVDPNPAHAGRADALLKKAGIAVRRNVMRELCEELIRPFATRMLIKRPMVTLKLACTLDGRIADARGTSKWITGSKARDVVQNLRRTADGIMIGAGTLRLDNPSLLPRPAYGRKPWRIIIAGSQPVPIRSKVFHDPAAGQTLVFAPVGFKQKHDLEKLGVEVIELPALRGRLSLKKVARELADRNCMHVVCEGGGQLAQGLLQAGLVDQLWMFYAPIILGGDAKPSVAGKGWRLGQSPDFAIRRTEQLGEDILVIAGRK